MKCYFCLTEPDSNNSPYLDLLYVSLKSARENTKLDLYVIYDGTENGRCWQILKEFDVKIIKQEFSHKQYLPKTFSKEDIKKLSGGNDIPYDKLAGTFMRFDIPFIEQEDDFVFYADIDVIFLKDFSHDSFDKTEYLAASTEFSKDLENMTYFNAGILYLNVKNMRKISSIVFDMLKNGIKNSTNLFDQGYLNQLCFDKMTVMPLEFNWKPYWGINDNVHIVHFHAMKPEGNIANSGFGMTQDALFHMLNGHFEDIGGYIYYLTLWYKILGKDGTQWISSFITLVFLTTINNISNNQDTINMLEKKYNKYKKIFKLESFILVILITSISLWSIL